MSPKELNIHGEIRWESWQPIAAPAAFVHQEIERIDDFLEILISLAGRSDFLDRPGGLVRQLKNVLARPGGTPFVNGIDQGANSSAILSRAVAVPPSPSPVRNTALNAGSKVTKRRLRMRRRCPIESPPVEP